MKYRVFALMGLLALTAGTVLHAQDYDDIYYDASKSVSKTTKAEKPAKTIAVYGEVPDQYKLAAQDNYRVERDEDEYNRRGAFEPSYEIDINGDTIFMEDEAFANTRRIERFYNPDIVILSDDDDLVELYYDESPTINLVVGTDMGYMASYGWTASYYPWYTGWYEPWSIGYYSPWYVGWHDPWYSGWYSPWYYSRWYGPSLWGWNYWGTRPWYHHHGWNSWYGWGGPNHGYHHDNYGWRGPDGRVSVANNRRPNGHHANVGGGTGHKNDIRTQGTGPKRGSVGNNDTRTRGGYATTRGGGNIGTRGTVPATTRRGGTVATPSSGNRTSSSGYYSGGSRSSGSYSGGSRSSGSYSGGSRSSGSYSGGSRSSGSYSGGSRSSGSSSSGSYSGGSRSSGSSGGSSGGGSSSRGGGGHRR